MKRTLWICNDCSKMDMLEDRAFKHAEVVRHRIRYQTPEDEFERKIALSRPKMTAQAKANAIASVEMRLSSIIYIPENIDEKIYGTAEKSPEDLMADVSVMMNKVVLPTSDPTTQSAVIMNDAHDNDCRCDACQAAFMVKLGW